MYCTSFGAASLIMILKLFVLMFLFQARYFFQQLISGVSYCHAMVTERNGLLNFVLFLTSKIYRIFCFISSVLNIISFLSQQICHRDLKLENTLLDGSPAPRLKICDFGYSKVWHI